MDLQNLVIQLPSTHRPKLPTSKPQPVNKLTDYPIALVPGQFTEHYREYTPRELL